MAYPEATYDTIHGYHTGPAIQVKQRQLLAEDGAVVLDWSNPEGVQGPGIGGPGGGLPPATQSEVNAATPGKAVDGATLAAATTVLHPGDIGTGPGKVAAGDDARIVNALQPLAKVLADAVTNRLVGHTPSTGKLLFSVYDHTGAGTYTPNPNCWAADIDLSGVCVYSSAQGGSRIPCTAITPRHVISCQHAPYDIGTVLRFRASDGAIVVRTVTAAQAAGSNDIRVMRLDSDLPATVRPVPLLPADWDTRVGTKVPNQNWTGVPVLEIDQERKANVTECRALAPTFAQISIAATGSPWAGWGEGWVDGDSGSPAFIIFDGQVRLLTTAHFGGGSNPGDYAGSGPNIPIGFADIAAAVTALGPAGYAITAPAFPANYVGPTPTVAQVAAYVPSAVPRILNAVSDLAARTLRPGDTVSLTDSAASGVGSKLILPDPPNWGDIIRIFRADSDNVNVFVGVSSAGMLLPTGPGYGVTVTPVDVTTVRITTTAPEILLVHTEDEIRVYGLDAPPLPATLSRWTVITANHTAAPGERLGCDLRGNDLTVTLPPAPVIGDTVEVWDMFGSAYFDEPNSCRVIVVARNGQNIGGIPFDARVDGRGQGARFVFTGGDWEMVRYGPDGTMPPVRVLQEFQPGGVAGPSRYNLMPQPTSLAVAQTYSPQDLLTVTGLEGDLGNCQELDVTAMGTGPYGVATFSLARLRALGVLIMPYGIPLQVSDGPLLTLVQCDFVPGNDTKLQRLPSLTQIHLTKFSPDPLGYVTLVIQDCPNVSQVFAYDGSFSVEDNIQLLSFLAGQVNNCFILLSSAGYGPVDPGSDLESYLNTLVAAGCTITTD